MKKLVLFTLLTYLCAYAVSAQSWTEDMYAKHTSQSFYALPIAHRKFDSKNVDFALLSAAIFYATNWARRTHNLPELVYDSRLAQAAQFHVKSMVKNDFFSHTGIENGYVTLGDRMRAFKVPGRTHGENIALRSLRGETYVEYAFNVIQSWLKSPGHRQNMLNKHFKALGTGAYVEKNGEWGGALLKTIQNFGG